MIVTTTNTVQGRSISEYLGIVFGEEVAGEGFSGWLGNFEGSFINLRNQALNEMCQNAAGLGANAVVGVSINYSSIVKPHSGASTNTYLMNALYYDGCVDDIRQYYSNGVLVFDDARAYIHAQTNDFMTWLQISRRQKSIDFISVFHGLTQVPPQYFTFASNLFLFYTKDNIKRRGVYVDETDFVRIQETKRRIAQKVADGDKYYFELINLDARI